MLMLFELIAKSNVAKGVLKFYFVPEIFLNANLCVYRNFFAEFFY